MLIQGAACGLFGIVAVATKHDHWTKEPGEVEPIVGPLCRIVEQLPAKTLKAFEKGFNGIALAVGCFAIVGPDLTHEIKLRRDERANREEEATGIRKQQPTRPNNTKGQTGNSDGRVRQGDAGEPSNGAAAWTATLPEGDAITDYGLPS